MDDELSTYRKDLYEIRQFMFFVKNSPAVRVSINGFVNKLDMEKAVGELIGMRKWIEKKNDAFMDSAKFYLHRAQKTLQRNMEAT